MKITLNKKITELKNYSEITVATLLKIMKYSFPMIIVKINGSIIKKENYEKTIIKNGDDVSAFHLISGG